MQTKSIRLTLAADQTYSKYKWTGTVSIGLTFKCWPVWNHELVTTQKSIISQTYRHISSRLNGIHTFHPKIFIPSIVLKRKGKSYFFPPQYSCCIWILPSYLLSIFYPQPLLSKRWKAGTTDAEDRLTDKGQEHWLFNEHLQHEASLVPRGRKKKIQCSLLRLLW